MLRRGEQVVGSRRSRRAASAAGRARRAAPPVSSGRPAVEARRADRRGVKAASGAPRPARSPAAARPGGRRSRRRPARSSAVSGEVRPAPPGRARRRGGPRRRVRSGAGVGAERRRSPWSVGTASGGPRTSRSPERRSGSRLVASTVSPGQAASRSATSGAASITCSKLSSTSRADRRRRARRQHVAERAVADLTHPEGAGDRRQRRGRARDTAPRATNQTPSANASAAASAAARRASRVLPTPPGPVSVTRRTSGRRSSSPTAAISRSRPTSEVSGTGRLGDAVPLVGGCSAIPVRPGGDVRFGGRRPAVVPIDGGRLVAHRRSLEAGEVGGVATARAQSYPLIRRSW